MQWKSLCRIGNDDIPGPWSECLMGWLTWLEISDDTAAGLGPPAPSCWKMGRRTERRSGRGFIRTLFTGKLCIRLGTTEPREQRDGQSMFDMAIAKSEIDAPDSRRSIIPYQIVWSPK